jgi:hypothetical protein
LARPLPEIASHSSDFAGCIRKFRSQRRLDRISKCHTKGGNHRNGRENSVKNCDKFDRVLTGLIGPALLS